MFQNSCVKLKQIDELSQKTTKSVIIKQDRVIPLHEIESEMNEDTLLDTNRIVPESTKIVKLKILKSNGMYKSIEKAKKRALVKSDTLTTGKKLVDTSTSFVLGKMPLNRIQAKCWAKEVNNYCRKLMNEKRYDSVYVYAVYGNTLYENSSLFYCKAVGAFHNGDYNAAVTACEIAEAKQNYWIQSDQEKTVRTMIESMRKIDEIYPSRVMKETIEKTEERYEKIQ